jgi:GGDEF domain-containing protein
VQFRPARFRIIENLLFICIIGLFFMLMLSSELVAIVEAQSLYDHVSGALNRRGIDQRLALELVRAGRNGYELAVALIDIDHSNRLTTRQAMPLEMLR